MITQEDLISAGYKPFKQSNIKDFTESFWQKRFDDAKGKKYFITIAEYNNSNYKELLDVRGRYSFEPESQFCSNGITFNITMLSPNSIEEMENFFGSMWVKMNCDYYEEF